MLNKSIEFFLRFLTNFDKKLDLRHYYKLIFIYLFFFVIFYILIDFLLFEEQLKNPRAWDFLISRVPQKLDVYIFFVSFTLLPIITYKFLNLSLENENYFNFPFISISSLSSLLFIEAILYQIGLKINLVSSLTIFVCVLFGFFSLLIPKNKKNLNKKLLEFFIILILLNVMIYKPFYRFESSENMNFYLNGLKNNFFFLKFFLFIIFFSLFLFFLGKVKINKISYGYLILFVPTFVFISFDLDFYSIDLHHYIPYMGPSLAINQGGLLGVDTFSQYGMGVSFISSVYFKFAPNTFFSFGLLIRIINFLSYITIVLLILRVSENKLFGLIASLIIIIFHITTMSNNMNAFPSTFGSRYLLPLLITYIITKEKFYKDTLNVYLISALYALSSFWSLECFIYANAILFGNLIAKLIYYRNFKNYYFLLKVLFIVLLFFHLFINIYYLLISGKFLDYYMLSLVTIKAGVISNAPQMRDFLGWIPFLIAYSLIFISYLNLLVKKINNQDNTLKLDNDFEKFVSSYLNLAILGVIIGIYYVNRSVPLALYFLYFPLLIIIYKTLESLIPYLVTKRKWIIFTCIIIIFSFLLTINFNKLINMKHPNEINKFTFIVNCFKGSCDINEYFFSKNQLIKSKFFETNYPKSMDKYNQILEQGLFFKKKYFNKKNKNLIFISVDHIPLSEMLFMQTESWYFHPISWIFSDSTVRELRERIINFNKYIKENQYIMFYNSKNLHHFEKEIVESIKKNWKFCLIEKGNLTVSVYKLKNKDKDCDK